MDWKKSPFNDVDGKCSASRILAFLAYLVALAHIIKCTFFVPDPKVDWSGISSFLVAVAVPYLGNSVRNLVYLFKRTKQES